MRIVDKATALQLLEAERQELLPTGAGCHLCALVAALEPAAIIQQSAQGLVVLDRFGNRPGHLLVLARRHVERTAELPWREYAALQRLAWEATRALEQVLGPKRVFIAALGASTPLPMSFPHFHLHAIPVYEDDERARPAVVFSWSSGVVMYEESEALALVESLRAAWPASEDELATISAEPT